MSTEKKKMHNVRVRVKFHLGQNENCSPGDSTLHSSERLLQIGSGGRSVYKILVKAAFSAIKHLLYKRFSASHEELMSLRAQSASLSTLDSLQGVSKVNSCSSTGFNLHRGRWQMPLAGANL